MKPWKRIGSDCSRLIFYYFSQLKFTTTVLLKKSHNPWITLLRKMKFGILTVDSVLQLRTAKLSPFAWWIKTKLKINSFNRLKLVISIIFISFSRFQWKCNVIGIETFLSPSPPVSSSLLLLFPSPCPSSDLYSSSFCSMSLERLNLFLLISLAMDRVWKRTA